MTKASSWMLDCIAAVNFDFSCVFIFPPFIISNSAQLLRARKRTQPSDSWLRQLPTKARKLEERLYRSAPTLEIYEDKSTLKNRLKKLARAIMLRYEGSSTRSSFRSSVSSLASSRSGSVVSHLQQHRDSFVSQNSMDSLSTLNNQMNQQMSGLGVSKERGGSTNDTKGSEASGTSNNNMDSIPEEGKGNGSLSSGADSKISMLEQQKQANERLQQQIMENIRKQEELLRRLQQQAGNNSGPGNNSNNAPNMMQQQQSQLQSAQSAGGQAGRMMQQQQQNSTSPTSLTSNTSWGQRSNNSSQGNSTMSVNVGQQQQQQQHAQQGMNMGVNRNNGNNMSVAAMQASLNNFIQMNPSVLNNPAQMQQLAQMRALWQRNGGMMSMAQNNPLMRSASTGSNTSTSTGNMMAGFPSGPMAQTGPTAPNQQQQMALAASMLGQNMMGLQSPPVLPGRAVSTGQIPTYSGFHPSMPPPPVGGGSLPQGGNTNNAAGAFSQFNNWRPAGGT